MGERQAILNLRAASQGKLFWEARVVDGTKTPVLDVTTEQKAGFIGPKGEFITDDGGKLMRTGQTLNPRQIQLINSHIKEGLKKSGH
jgi:hypothetical protein